MTQLPKTADEQVNEIINAEFIQTLISSWAGIVLVIPKKDGPYLCCVDCSKLDAVPLKNCSYPLPHPGPKKTDSHHMPHGFKMPTHPSFSQVHGQSS